jgi:hypothetical protein
VRAVKNMGIDGPGEPCLSGFIDWAVMRPNGPVSR